MVFSSAPLYLDPPNWQQHEIQQNPHQHVQPAAPSQGMGSSSRASGSMAERARMAKIPVPDGPLNCPRCDSTNTKFCYFNNYSLTQPRHFCKACRRYWTRGGALRSVPVGGGCRRNKRRKRAKSPKPPPPQSAAAEPHHTAAPDQNLAVPTTAISGSPFSFMASLQNMTSMRNLGLGFGALQPPPNHQQQRQQQQQQQQQQLSLFGGFGAALTEPANSPLMYPFQINGGGMETASFGKAVGVKMEEMRARAGQLRGGTENNNVGQFWSTSFNNSVAGSANGGLWN